MGIFPLRFLQKSICVLVRGYFEKQNMNNLIVKTFPLFKVHGAWSLLRNYWFFFFFTIERGLKDLIVPHPAVTQEEMSDTIWELSLNTFVFIQ